MLENEMSEKVIETEHFCLKKRQRGLKALKYSLYMSVMETQRNYAQNGIMKLMGLLPFFLTKTFCTFYSFILSNSNSVFEGLRMQTLFFQIVLLTFYSVKQ